MKRVIGSISIVVLILLSVNSSANAAVVTFTGNPEYLKSTSPSSIVKDTSKSIEVGDRMEKGSNFQTPIIDMVIGSFDESLINQGHPRSFIGEKQLKTAKARIQADGWGKNYFIKLKNKADATLKKDLTVPEKAAGHSSWYICKNGSALKYQNGGHYCAADKTYYEGEKYDAGWLYSRHNEVIQSLKTLATVYALSGEEKYGAAAKGILLGYAQNYPSYPVQVKGGRLYYQSLDEAVNMVDMIQAYDFLYDSGLFTPKEKLTIEANLLKASVQTLKNYPMNKSNWQAWHNAAIGMAGFVLGDQDIIEEAIFGELGFQYLMKGGVMEDGLWWEGSMAYHSYTLAPLNMLAEGAAKWGYDLYSASELKRMFDAPLLYAYPNFMLPTNNDGGTFGTSIINTISSRGYNDYEAAFSRYQESSYGYLLDVKYKKVTRAGDFALFFGADEIPVSENSTVKSANFKNVGHAILRTNTETAGDQTYLLMDYGPHGGYHGHYDKLSIDLFGAGTMLAPDFGTPGYSHPMYKSWYKQTASHNTVVVDGNPQQESTGEILAFTDHPDFLHMNATANTAYEGVHYERAIWMEPNYVLDWFTVSDPKKKHTFDWFLHGLGDLSTNLDLEPGSFGYTQAAYNQFSAIKSATVSKDIKAVWNQENAGMNTLLLADDQPSNVFTAMASGPSNAINVKTPALVQRKIGNEAEFVALHQPFKTQGSKSLIGVREGKNGVRVDRENQSVHYYRNYASMLPGQLLSAKAGTVKGMKLDFKSFVTASYQPGKLNIKVDAANVTSDISLLYHVPGNVTVYVNGKETKANRDGDQLFIQVKK